jgi:hypothetical protein
MVAMGMRPRLGRRVRRLASHHRSALAGPGVADRAMPPTWRAWEAQNGGKRWYIRYPLAVEWALEWFVYRLRGLALFDLLELAGKLTVVVASSPVPQSGRWSRRSRRLQSA